MKNSLKIILIVIISFSIYFVLDDMYFKDLRKWFYELTNHFGISHVLTYIIFGIPFYLGTLIIHPKILLIKSLNLNKSILSSFVFAVICTLPMFIGFTFLFEPNFEISLDTVLISVISAGFFEELFFRGFLFGEVFKNTKLGFIPAVFFGAVYFGLLHLYQSNELDKLIGIFLITFLGSILFAWLLAEWNFNIWIPVFLHMLMNLAWELFSISDNALGGIYSNVFRFLTIVLVITLTIWYKKRKALKLEINRNTILIKRGLPNYI